MGSCPTASLSPGGALMPAQGSAEPALGTARCSQRSQHLWSAQAPTEVREEKKKQVWRLRWRLLVPFGWYRCVSCCALRQGACSGQNGFVFSCVNRLSHLSPTPCRSVSSHSQWLPSDQLLALPVIRYQFLLLAKSRVLVRNRKFKKEVSHLRESNSKTRSAIINRQAIIMADVGTDVT